MEQTVKQKKEPLMTLKVNRETRDIVKKHCVDNNLWMSKFVEAVLTDYITKQKQ